MIHAWFRLVLRHRKKVLGIVLLITVGCAAFTVQRAIIATSLAKMFMGENPEFQRYMKLAAEFGSDEVLVFAFPQDDPLAVDRVDALTEAAERILEMDDIARVDSIYTAQEIRTGAGMLKVRRYGRAARDEPDKRSELLAAITSDEHISGTLISPDGRHIALIVQLTPVDDRPAERGPQIIGGIRQILLDTGIPAKSLHKAGLPAIVFEVIEESRKSLSLRFPIVAFVLVLVVFLIFRGLLPVAVTMGVSLLAVVWTTAFSVLIDPHISVALAMVPAVVLIVGFSDVIHLYSAYLLELADGAEQQDAIVNSSADVGRACLYTSLTTFVGFMGLSLVPTPMFRQMGMVLGFGVGVALLIAVTAMPVVLSMLPPPLKSGTRWGEGSRLYTLLDRVLGGLARISSARPWLIAGGWAVWLLVCGYGISVLNVETDLEARMGKDSVVQRDKAYFDAHFSGNAMLELYLHTDKDGGVLEPDAMRRMAAFSDAVLARPDVDAVGSLIDLMRRIHRTLGEADKGELPDTRNAFAQYLLLFEMGGGSDLEPLVDFPRRSLRMNVRLNTGGFREAAIIGDEIKLLAKTHLGGPGGDGTSVRLEVTGLAYLMGTWLDEILAGQRNGILLSGFVVMLMMMFVAGSARVGVWSMLPNVLPLLTLGGYVGLMWPKVDSDTLAVALLAIGIGVDDTIHFVSRYRVEVARGLSDRDAIRRTFIYAGRAIVMTTVILVLGFLPHATSDYFSTEIMGTLLPMALVVALLADLTLVPALVKLGPMSLTREEPEKSA